MKSLLALLSLRKKLGLLGLTAAALVALPTLVLVRTALTDIASIEHESAGMTPSTRLLRVLQLTQQHRGLSASALSGNATAAKARASKQLEVDTALKSFEQILQAQVHNPQIGKRWQTLAGEWTDLSRSIAAQGLAGPESFARHTALIAHLIELHDRVADHFGLTLDPQASTYHLIIGTLVHLPRLTEALGQARALGSTILNSKEATVAQRINLASLSGSAQSGLREMTLSVDKSGESEPALALAMKEPMDKTRQGVTQVLTLIEQQVLRPETHTYAANDYFANTTQAIDSVYALNHSATRLLSSMLSERVHQAQVKTATLLAVLLLLLGLGA